MTPWIVLLWIVAGCLGLILASLAAAVVILIIRSALNADLKGTKK